MKRFAFGVVVGFLTYEALLQLIWVGGKFEDWTALVNEKMWKSPLRSRLRKDFAKMVEKAEAERNVTIDLGTLNPGEFEAEVNRILREARGS